MKKGIYIDKKNPSIITITKIDLSDDLKYAKVFFTSISDEKRKDELEEHLNENSSTYKYIVGKKIRTKSIPSFKFIYDNIFVAEFNPN